MSQDLSPSVLEQFEAVVGSAGLLTGAAQLAPFLSEWRGLYQGAAPALIAPASTAEAAAVIRICGSLGIGVVPQGGNTGLVGGAVPHSTQQKPQILLSARRMNRIRELDAANFTVTAEAGCLLASVQDAAEASGCLFPLSLAAEGSCQLGGNISTNAGGTNVLRYGNTRDLILGLEAVLPDGRVYDGLRGLRKDNTGYDLKQLFIGAEGTLGFVTAAVCKLFPRPLSVSTALVTVADPDAAVELYNRARARLGDQLNAFELISDIAMNLVTTHIPGSRNPLAADSDWFVLMEAGHMQAGDAADQAMQAFLAAQIETGLVLDGTLAQTGEQREQLWRIRHGISEAEKLAGAGIKHDISLPLSTLAGFLRDAVKISVDRIPGVLVVAFGHLGDGNLHFNLNQPDGMETRQFMGHWDAISREIHGLAVGLGGSFSAEHGVGTLKSAELERLGDPVAVDLMRILKRAIDPSGIMNPGKLLLEE